jgi:hypothetical protein
LGDLSNFAKPDRFRGEAQTSDDHHQSDAFITMPVSCQVNATLVVHDAVAAGNKPSPGNRDRLAMPITQSYPPDWENQSTHANGHLNAFVLWK